MGQRCIEFPLILLLSMVIMLVLIIEQPVSISQSRGAGYVTAQVDDGLRVLPEILLSKGEVNVDMLNFAVSPGKYHYDCALSVAYSK